MSMPTRGEFHSAFATSYRVAETALALVVQMNDLIRRCDEQTGEKWDRRADLLRQTVKRANAARAEMEGVRSRLVNSWNTDDPFPKPE